MKAEMRAQMEAHRGHCWTVHELMAGFSDDLLVQVVTGTCQARNVADRVRNILARMIADGTVVASRIKDLETPAQLAARHTIQDVLRTVKPEMCGNAAPAAGAQRRAILAARMNGGQICGAPPAPPPGSEFCGPTPSHRRTSNRRRLTKYRLAIDPPCPPVLP
jgi:hypothetical protein